jgi:hypothetical protein
MWSCVEWLTVPVVAEELDSFLFMVCAGSTQAMVVVISSTNIPENLNRHHTCYQNPGTPHSAAVYMHYHDPFSHFNNIHLHILFYGHVLLHFGLETIPLLMSFA